MKGHTVEGFGERLTRIRKGRGMTQVDLGKKVGLSDRMIAYYEREDAQAPGPLLVQLAAALGVTTDELLGARPLRTKSDPRSARLMNRLKKIEHLPPADQRALLKVLDGLLARHGKTNGKHGIRT